MQRLLITLCLLLGPTSASLALEMWDALPALEPTHVQGPYVGRQVCPVCAHGYDAGILVFLPPSTSVSTGRELRASLAPTSLAGAEPRFRTFMIITGTPSNALLESLRLEDDRWLVATLTGRALTETRTALESQWQDAAHGYVFAQRRLLGVLSEDGLLAREHSLRRAAVDYALRFLSLMHPIQSNGETKASDSAMWFAPAKLDSALTLEGQAKQYRVCFVPKDAASPSQSLVRIRDSSSSSVHWARTDSAGCLSIAGSSRRALAATVYPRFANELEATIEVTPKAIRFAQTQSTQRGAAPSSSQSPEPIVGLPCEGCEAVFVDMPAEVGPNGRISPTDEPGEPLRVTGRILDPRGAPAANIIVYAYQTNAAGRYPRFEASDGSRVPHGRLRGWARADAQGRYTFETIRPGAYPGRRDPQHIHMHIIEPGRCTYYIGDILFDDDPRLTQQERSKAHTSRGGSGIAKPRKDRHDVWHVQRDIRLGLNVPGYDACRHRGDTTPQVTDNR